MNEINILQITIFVIISHFWGIHIFLTRVQEFYNSRPFSLIDSYFSYLLLFTGLVQRATELSVAMSNVMHAKTVIVELTVASMFLISFISCALSSFA